MTKLKQEDFEVFMNKAIDTRQNKANARRSSYVKALTEFDRTLSKIVSTSTNFNNQTQNVPQG